MPFPLPIDPKFRKEIVVGWLEDVDDRLELGQVSEALDSLKEAHKLYLNLPAGHGDAELERWLIEARVKIVKHQSM